MLISFETFAHVKDEIHCEERGQVRVKGIAHPVATYAVIGLRSEPASTWGPVHTDVPHLKLEIEPDLMSTDERQRAASTLRHALGILEGQGELDQRADTDQKRSD
jgi:hypothetical protein